MQCKQLFVFNEFKLFEGKTELGQFINRLLTRKYEIREQPLCLERLTLEKLKWIASELFDECAVESRMAEKSLMRKSLESLSKPLKPIKITPLQHILKKLAPLL